MSTEAGLSVDEKRDFLSVLKHLRELVDEPEIMDCVRYQGICDNVTDMWEDLFFEDDLSARLHVTKNAMFEVWPEYSGCITHPVPSGEDDCTPQHKFSYTDDMWVDEYGAARRRLLAFLIEQLEASQ